MKILLVDDSKFLRLATERALARAGYDVVSAADGEEALRKAQANIPDLILLDMMLPKMSGPDVLKALKKDSTTAAIPVVVLTGSHKKTPTSYTRTALSLFWRNPPWLWTRVPKHCWQRWQKSSRGFPQRPL